MNELKVDLKNCYGLQALKSEFEFSAGNPDKPKKKAYAIYAPNGLMKSSFAKTFEMLSLGESPKEERYNRTSSCNVEADGIALVKESIYVLKAEIDIHSDSSAMTDILVNPAQKARYDELLVDLDKQKKKLLTSLSKQSKLKDLNVVESKIIEDCGLKNLPDCIDNLLLIKNDSDLSPYEYGIIFEPKLVAVLNGDDFVAKANEFNQRYQKIFEESGVLYKKGVFNPEKAETVLSALDKQGYFATGHRVHLKDDENALDKAEFSEKLRVINASIDADLTLKKIRDSLQKNDQTRALTSLMEILSSSQVDFLLENIKPDNQSQFRKEIWAFLLKNSDEARQYLETFKACKTELASIESEAVKAVPLWVSAVNLFNNRFVGMPFTLSVANQAQAVLGKGQARLIFTFKDGGDIVNWSRAELKTLSQGEMRAVYLLNFIFDVEARKLAGQETLFIIDDAADSFDYKNKNAIIQYLAELNNTSFFYQIILTHNFDFFRALANTFIHYSRCLMANRCTSNISLEKASGIKNYFINKIKDKVPTDNSCLCASIPFTRNLIEYTRGDDDPDYLKLTSMLHWKENTAQLTTTDYFNVYNRLFGTAHIPNRSQPVKDLIFSEADNICRCSIHNGLDLENKILLSIAIRLRSESFLIDKIRLIRNDPGYWCPLENQFGNLMKEFVASFPCAPELPILEKVSITVSSNIHLNSFMYEPILDLTIEHLVNVYNEVKSL